MPSESEKKKVLERESLIRNGGCGGGRWPWWRKWNRNCQKKAVL